MGLLEDLLHNLVGGGAPRAAAGMAKAAQPMAARPQMGAQPMGQSHGAVTPGYEQQAAQYEQAMNNHDYNNPIVVGPKAIDPKFFGYGPDTGVRPPGPAPMRTEGLPQNFYGAPQLPIHNPDLYSEVFRVGGLNMPPNSTNSRIKPWF